jgi:DNA-binding transcriptional regulator GbsR (MarR family)
VTDDESSFVEEMGQYLGSVGMTPMAGRMWAWLLICVPPEQTAAELADALMASRGAISGTSRILENVGFIRRTRRRGDRREYFSAPPGAFGALLLGASEIYRRFREVTEHGVGVVADRPPADRRRMQEVHDFVVFVEGMFPAMLQGYVEEQARLGATDNATAGPLAMDASPA